MMMSRFVEEIRDSARVVAGNARLGRIAAVAVFAELSAPVYYTAAAVWAFTQGGALLAALFGVVAMVPAAVVAPVAAVVTDRVRRDLVIVVSLAVRSGLLLVLATGMALGSAWLVLGAAMVASMCARALYPAVAATLPAVTASRAELVSANALVSGIENVGAVVGPALAGAALVALPESAVVACAALGTLAAASAGLRLGAIRPARDESAEGGLGLDELGAGFVSLCADRTTRTLVAAHAVQCFAVGALGVVLVQVAIDDLRLGPPGLGLLETALAVGGVAGGVIAVGRAATCSPAGTVRASAMLFAVPLGLAALVLQPSVVVAGLAVAGVANVLLDVVVYTHVQEATDDAVLARTVAALQSATVLAVGLGGLVAGVLLSTAGSRVTLALVALSVPAAALTLVRPHTPPPRPVAVAVETT